MYNISSFANSGSFLRVKLGRAPYRVSSFLFVVCGLNVGHRGTVGKRFEPMMVVRRELFKNRA